ncbi:MAG: malonate decarboxylase subunit beta [Gammaproteobacteria bacterium SG8_31]|nr:MAG: malonate decarboxylase subunit beta [Gammaproteobacteria bacterium SG8_31]
MSRSFFEATARRRVLGLLDPDSFEELLPPTERITSPHLPELGVPCAFDDGIVIGRGRLDSQSVLIAAQEGGFMGGAVGEIHGAKLTGLLERALDERPAAVLLLIDSGGVRLHEANAGLIAISEIMRALFEVRALRVPVISLVGGQTGCFGGMGIVACCCDTVVMSEEGRLGLSGPEVIETALGVEEFDSQDRALVWRTVGGKHRYVMGDADCLVKDDIAAFRQACLASVAKRTDFSLAVLVDEHERLRSRLERFRGCADALDIWDRCGIANPERLPLLDNEAFLAAVNRGAD